MSSLRVIFLGTGTSQGIPVINSNHPVGLSTNKKDKRLRSSIVFAWEEYVYVIDCGPDFRYQMLRENINSINGVVFTHEHADHTAGLDDLRPYSFQLGAVPVYGQKRVLDNLSQRFDYIFKDADKYPGAPSIQKNVITNERFQLHNLDIQPIEVNHGILKIFGYRIRNFAYLTDVKSLEQVEKDKLMDLDVLVVNAIRHKAHRSHFNLEEALSFIAEIRPKKAFLTHISQHLGFHDEVEGLLPSNVFLAYDGLKIDLE